MDCSILPCTEKTDRQFISQNLGRYNEQFVQVIFQSGEIKMDFKISNESGEIIAGILGALDRWGGLHIYILWVQSAERGKGLGAQLMQHAEKMAKENGAIVSKVETASFQAKDFYLKMGYTLFGTIPDFPKGHEFYCFYKEL